MAQIEIKTIKLRERGQIVIPQDFREELRLHTGENLVAIRKGNEIVIKKADTMVKGLTNERKIDAEKASWLKLAESAFAKDWSSAADDIWDSY